MTTTVSRAVPPAHRPGRRRAAGIACVSASALVAGLLLTGAPAGAAEDRRAPSTSGDVRVDPRADESVDDTTTPELPPPPVPAVPVGLPVQVDPLPLYEGQAACRPPEVTALNKGTVALAQLIRDTYGSFARAVGGIHRICSMGGRDPVFGSQSEHKEGRAVDWMIDRRVDAERRVADAFIDWLLATDENGNEFAMARRLGVMYIGWDDRIWESYTKTWSELKGCFATPQPGYDTYCHRDHIHLSLSWDGAAGATSFWGGSPTPLPFCNRWTTSSSIAHDVGEGLDYIATTPRRVLDTRSGLGLPGGNPCRLWQRSGGIRLPNGSMNPLHSIGAPVVLRVADLPGAQGRDVRAVAVRTSTFGSNSPATLRSRTFAGATIAPIAIGARTETVTVLPVAVDGTIGFTTDSGATNLQVDVLGYFVAPQNGQRTGGRLTLPTEPLAYDTADDTWLGAGEQRIISLARPDTLPSGAIIGVTVTSTSRPGELVVRRTGDRRTAATPSIAYRSNDTVTQSVLANLDASGQLILVNRGRAPIHVRLTAHALAVPALASGSMLVPVAPTEVSGARTALRRVLREARGSTAVVLQVDARTSAGAGSVRFWSGDPTRPVVLDIGRASQQSSLLVVPLDAAGLIFREVDGEVAVSARIVAYLR